MPQLRTVDPKKIKIESQVRKSFPQQEMDELTASIKKHGVLQPPLVTKDVVLLTGERRVRCSITAGLETIPVIETDRLLTDSEIRVIQLTENIQRQPLMDPEVYLACKELMAINKWMKKELAAHLDKNASTVTRILSVDDLIPAAKEAFLAGAFGFAKAYEISKADEKGQHELLDATLGGSTRQAVIAKRAQKQNGNGQAVRVSRLKLPLPSGAVVQVSGAELSLEETVEALQQIVSEAKKALARGLTAKTFERACRDLAKKGE